MPKKLPLPIEIRLPISSDNLAALERGEEVPFYVGGTVSLIRLIPTIPPPLVVDAGEDDASDLRW